MMGKQTIRWWLMDRFIMAQIQMEAMELWVMATNKIWQWQMDFQVQFKQEGIWC